MPHTINQDECLQCGACEAECTKSAIFERDGMYYIDAAKCEDCGDCISVCPNDAIAKA